MPVKFTQNEAVITLQLNDFDRLILYLGFAAGFAMRSGEGREFFFRVIDLANTINEGNPDYIPYEVPDEYKGK